MSLCVRLVKHVFLLYNIYRYEKEVIDMCLFKKWKEKRKAKQQTHNKELTKTDLEAKTPIVEDKIEEPKVISQTHVEKQVEKEAPKNEMKQQKSAKYHVSQNKDSKSEGYKKWRVRKEGSSKTIKYFDTQKEAIQFAEELAENAGSSVVIHKVDGSIRKQDYTK